MNSVYVIQHSVTKELHVGYTSNLKQSIIAHNSKKSIYTSRQESREWALVYAEIFRNIGDARHRENMFKQRGRTKQELIKRIKNSLL